MLIIRLSRVGKKNHPQYKLVVAEKTAPVKGRFVEQLGSYNPHQKVAVIKAERVQYWISKGAACSDTAWNLLVGQKVVEGAKRKVKLPDKKTETEAQEAGVAKTQQTAEPVKLEEKDQKTEELNKSEEKVEEKKEEPVKEEKKLEEKVEEKKEEKAEEKKAQ